MARGWESKSVESQIDDARTERENRASVLTPEEREKAQKRHSLEMSKKRIESQLRATQSAAHRQALQHALEYLDDEIRKLD